ncbi:hypothetical protein J4231_03435 [Candidatus Woesearchaeota archaeon]|nr:hypothetical protein [Candidatus Woesearchaeota archaeon]
MRMKKEMLLLVLLVLIVSLAASAAAYYRDDYWECTSEGEASLGDAYGRRVGDICGSDCCKLCISPNVYQDCLGPEAQPPCQCTNGNPNDFQPPTITIVSPQPTAYNVNDILIKIQIDEPSTIKRKLDSSALYTMCSGCSSAQYQANNLNEGTHTLYVQAIDQNNNKANKTITFTIDTLSPVIKEVKPASGSYLNNSWNEFSVIYDENNVVSTVFKYKSAAEGSWHSVPLVGCQSGTDKSCETLVNLNSYAQGSVLSYYFEISDAMSTTSSGTSQATINNGLALLPFIINRPENNGIYGTRYVPFDLSTADASSFYYSTDGVRFNKLCTNCKSYVKNLTSIKEGEHDLIIRKIDANGINYDREVHILKDTKNPKIRNTLPNKNDYMGNGAFSVTYDENYLREVELNYGPTGNENIVKRNDCPGGKKMTCTFNGIDLSSYNGQQIFYSFKVSDYVRSVDSKNLLINVDTAKPVLTVNNPLEGGTYDNYVNFNLASNEIVEIEISDNGGTYSKLCGDCTTYVKRKSFGLGGHNLNIRATDLAGNVDQKNVNFIVY